MSCGKNWIELRKELDISVRKGARQSRRAGKACRSSYEISVTFVRYWSKLEWVKCIGSFSLHQIKEVLFRAFRVFFSCTQTCGESGCNAHFTQIQKCMQLYRIILRITTTHIFKWSQIGAQYFLIYLFQLLYMFRATMCPSSGELTLSMRHWYFSLCMVGCLVSEKYQCRIDTVSSPDDGDIVARSMYRSWNKYTKK